MPTDVTPDTIGKSGQMPFRSNINAGDLIKRSNRIVWTLATVKSLEAFD